MTEGNELNKFYEELRHEIVMQANFAGPKDFHENVFTQLYVNDLCEAAELEDGNVCHYEARGVKVNGYSIAEDDTSITLFVSIYKDNPQIFTVPPSDAIAMIKRAKQFYLKSLTGYHNDIEEALEAFNLARTIYEYGHKITDVTILLLTNGTIRSTKLETEIIDGVTFTSAVWDLERIYRVITSGSAREKIEFNLKELTGTTLDAVKTEIPEESKQNKDGTIETSGSYTSYLTVFPGTAIFKIYERYNARILERNVRAFLQVKGAVNKGIKATIQNEPGMFLAYNNGISATAENIETIDDDGRHCTIVGLQDFQIVNGGQTTASIYNSCLKDQGPLKKIFVPAKITVLKNQAQMDRVVPQISKYANTQNKIQLADFTANDPYHRVMEHLSRTVWTPHKTGGALQTKWFYERARGAYTDERSRAKSTKQFDAEYPKGQYFTKLELARYENLWNQLPFITSKGGQASFRYFTVELQKQAANEPSAADYKNLIAKAILYRQIKKTVKKQDFLGFWANITDYTVAYLNYKTANKLDLQKIWEQQDITKTIENAAVQIANAVYKYLTATCAGQNTTQWCKKEECWKQIKEQLSVSGYDNLKDNLLKPGVRRTASTLPVSKDDQSGKKLIENIKKVDEGTWFKISHWGKESQKLQPWQNSIAHSLGVIAKCQGIPTIKQARQGIIILILAVDNGFIVDPEIKAAAAKYKNRE